MAGENSGHFPFTTDIRAVGSEIKTVITEINGDFEKLHGPPNDLLKNMLRGVFDDVEKAVGQIERLQRAIEQAQKLPGGAKLAGALNNELTNVRTNVATRIGTAAQATGLDLSGHQRRIDAVIVDKLLPALKTSVQEVSKFKGLGPKISGSVSSFQAVTKQAQKLDTVYLEAVNTARREAQFVANSGPITPPAPAPKSATDALDPAKIAAARASHDKANATIDALDPTTKKAARATPVVPPVADPADAIKLTRLSEAQVKALSHLRDTFQDFQVDFPTKTTAVIPRGHLPNLHENIREQSELHAGNLEAGGTPAELSLNRGRLASLQSLTSKINAADAAYTADAAAHTKSATVTEEATQATARHHQVLTQADLLGAGAGQKPPNLPPTALGSPQPDEEGERKAFESRRRRQQHDVALLENERFDEGGPRLAPDGSRLLAQAFEANELRERKAFETRRRRQQHDAALLENDRFNEGAPRLAPDGSRLLAQAFEENDKRTLKASETRLRANELKAAELENQRYNAGLPRLAPDGSGLLEKAFAENDRRNLKANETRLRTNELKAAELENQRFDAGLPRLAPDGSRLLDQAFTENNQRNLKATETRLRSNELRAAELENQRFDAGLPRLAPDGSRLLAQAFADNDKRNLKATETRLRSNELRAAELENQRYDAGLPRLAPDGSGLLARAFAENDKRNIKAQTTRLHQQDLQRAELENQRYDAGLPRLAPDGSRLLEQAFEENNKRNLKASETRLRRNDLQAAELENQRFDAGLPRLAPDGSRLLAQAFAENDKRNLKASETRLRSNELRAAELENQRFDAGLPRLAPDGSRLLAEAFAENDKRKLKASETRLRTNELKAAELENQRFDAGLPRLAPDGSRLLAEAFAENDKRNLKAQTTRLRQQDLQRAELENERFNAGLPRLAPDGSRLLEQAFAENDKRNIKAQTTRLRQQDLQRAELENQRFDAGLPRLAPDGSRLLEQAFAENNKRNLKAQTTRLHQQDLQRAELENERFNAGLPRLAPDGSRLLEQAFAENDKRNLKAQTTRLHAQDLQRAELENERFNAGLPRLAPDGSRLLEQAFAENDRRNIKAQTTRLHQQDLQRAELENQRFNAGLPRLAPDGSRLLEQAFAENDKRNLKAQTTRLHAQDLQRAELENQRFNAGLPRLAPDGSRLLAQAFAENDKRNIKAQTTRLHQQDLQRAELENQRFDAGLPRRAPDGSRLLQQAFDENRARNAKEQEIQAQRDNAARLRGSARDGSYENATRVGPKLVEDALGQLYRETAEGLRKLGREESLQARGHINPNFGGNTSGSLGGAFLGGLTSSSNNGGNGKFDPLGLARSAGVTVKYAVLGSSLYAVAGAAKAAGQELLDFEDSVTEVDIALEGTGVKGSQSFFNDLADSAVNAGANIGQAMDVAASGIRSFKDEAGGSGEKLKDIGRGFANEAAKLAVISKTDITDAAGNLKAAMLAFDIPAGNFSRISDVIAGAKQLGGGDEKQISQGLANIAVSFNELGFSAEEAGSIVSKVQAETDESGTLIASRLTRATTILGGTAGKSALAKLNASLPTAQKIDLKANGRDQILQLSNVWKDLGAAQKQVLVNQLGGTAAARELVILLENAGQLVEEADKGFTGKGEEEYQRRLKDIAAQLTAIKGEIRQIVVQITTSGLLDPFLIFIKEGLHPALDVLRKMLQTFNLIPHVIRTIGGSLLAVYAITKLIRIAQTPGSFGVVGNVGRGIIGSVGNARRVVRDDVAGLRRGALENYSRYDLLRGRGLGRVESFRGSFGSIGPAIGAPIVRGVKGIASALGPIGITLALATLATSFFNASKNINRAVANLSKYRALPKDGLDDVNLRDLAVNLRTAAHQLHESSSGVIGSTVNFFRGDPTGKAADEANRYATALEKSIKASEKATKEAQERGDDTDLASLIDLNTLDGLTTSLKSFDDAGYNATTQFRALVDAMDQMTAGSSGAVKAISEVNRQRFIRNAGLAADAAQQDVEVKSKEHEDKKKPLLAKLISPLDYTTKEIKRGFGIDSEEAQRLYRSRNVDKTALSAAANKATSAFLADPKNNIRGPEGRKALVDMYTKAFQGILPQEDIPHIAGATADAVQKDWSTKYGGLTAAQLPAFYKTAGQVASASAEEAGRANALAGVPITADNFQSDSTAVARARKARLLELKQVGIDSFNNLSAKDQETQSQTFVEGQQQFNEDIKSATIDVAAGALNDLKATQGLVNAGKPSEDQLGRIRDTIADLDAQLAVPDLNPTDEIGIRTERATALIQELLQVQADAMSAARLKIDPRDTVANANQDVTDDQTKLDELASRGVTTGQTVDDLKLKQIKDQQTADREKLTNDISLRNVNATPDSALDTSTRKLADDQDLLTTMLEGSTEYNTKLAEINQDKVQLAKDISAGIRAAARADLDSRDAIGNAQADIDDTDAALKIYSDQGITTGTEVDTLKRTRAEQVLAKKQRVRERDIAKRNVNAFPDSAIDTATRALADDHTLLEGMLVGTKEYYDQLAKINQDERALATAKRAGASLARQLTIDLTDPVAVARQAAKDARDKLKADIAAEEPADVINADKKESRTADASLDATAFSQRLSDAQTADQLGQISHQAYLKYLNNEHDRLTSRLAGIKYGTQLYRQTFEQLQQVDGAIKSAADAVSQQFNIGNIRVPTVYEIRKAIKLKTPGGVAESNSSGSGAGSVVNDNSNRSITLNGVPVEQILSLIEGLYGKPARATAKRRIS